MAEIIITHFKSFDLDEMRAFEEKAGQVAGRVIYDLSPDDMDPNDVTTKTQPVILGASSSGAPAETEVNVLCAEEVWPRDDEGRPLGQDEAIRKALGITVAMGRLLLGGVRSAGTLRVPVWTDIKPATGWYGPDTEEQLQDGRLTIDEKYDIIR